MTHNAPNMSEQELLNDALTTEKHLLHSYGTYVAEASCQNLRNNIDQIINETQQIQYEIFDAMQKKGWYQIKQAKLDEVQQAVNKFRQNQP